MNRSFLPLTLIFFLALTVACRAGTALPLETQADAKVADVVKLVEGFFAKLQTEDVTTALKPVFQIFPIREEAQNGFINDVTRMKLRLGNVSGSEFLGFRRFGRSDRYFLVYFFTFHDRMPVAWEFTFFQPKPAHSGKPIVCQVFLLMGFRLRKSFGF